MMRAGRRRSQGHRANANAELKVGDTVRIKEDANLEALDVNAAFKERLGDLKASGKVTTIRVRILERVKVESPFPFGWLPSEIFVQAPAEASAQLVEQSPRVVQIRRRPSLSDFRHLLNRRRSSPQRADLNRAGRNNRASVAAEAEEEQPTPEPGPGSLRQESVVRLFLAGDELKEAQKGFYLPQMDRMHMLKGRVLAIDRNRRTCRVGGDLGFLWYKWDCLEPVDPDDAEDENLAAASRQKLQRSCFMCFDRKSPQTWQAVSLLAHELEEATDCRIEVQFFARMPEIESFELVVPVMDPGFFKSQPALLALIKACEAPEVQVAPIKLRTAETPDFDAVHLLKKDFPSRDSMLRDEDFWGAFLHNPDFSLDNLKRAFERCVEEYSGNDFGPLDATPITLSDQAEAFASSLIVWDCFLSHNWRNDGDVTDANHARVSEINDQLRDQGLVTWFDDQELTGDIHRQIAHGIQSSRKVLIFITRAYMRKIDSRENDNCKLEFDLASDRKLYELASAEEATTTTEREAAVSTMTEPRRELVQVLKNPDGAKSRGSVIGRIKKRLSRTASHRIMNLYADERNVMLIVPSTQRNARRQTSLPICTVDQVTDVNIEDTDENEGFEGVWTLEFRNSNGELETRLFRSKSSFYAVGWVQHFRTLRGMKRVRAVAVMGKSGAGKSTLCNEIAGRNAFQVGAGADAVTFESKLYLTRWFGEADGDELVVVDTPGLSDPQNRDTELMTNMFECLSELGGVETFLIVINSQDPRFDMGLQRMLKVFEQRFGRRFWDHVILVFSRWAMDERSVRQRADANITEESKREDWSRLIAEKLPNAVSERRQFLPAVFVDSCPYDDQEKAETRDRLDHIRYMATAQSLFDCRLSNMRTDVYASGTVREEDVAEESKPLVELLSSLQLEHRLKGLLDDGVTTLDVLFSIGEGLEDLGWTDEEIQQLAYRNADISIDAPNFQVVEELRALGLPQDQVIVQQLDARQLMKMSRAEVKEDLRYRVGDIVKFHKWRQLVLDQVPVHEDFLWPGCLVKRNQRAWPFDNREKRAVHMDMRGAGVVLSFRRHDGSVVGSQKLPQGWHGSPDAFNAPTQPGWVRVYWFASGYTNTYKMAPGEWTDEVASERVDLIFVSFDKAHVLSINPMDPTATSFDESAVRPTLEHLRCRFRFAKGIKGPHLSLFDTRPEICEEVGGFRHGDVVKVDARLPPELAGNPMGAMLQAMLNNALADKEFICVGVSPDSNGSLKLWFHDPEDAGAGILSGDGELTKVSEAEVTEHGYDDWDAHSDDGIENDELDWVAQNIEETFTYGIGNNFPEPAQFDIRDEILEKFKFGLRHGDRLELKRDDNSRMFTVVGVSMHNADYPRFWMHEDGDAGATIWLRLHEDLGSKFAATGENRGPLQPLNVNEDFWWQMPSPEVVREMTIRETYQFPKGRHVLVRNAMFDVSDEVCLKLCGYKSGTVLQVRNRDFFLTVVGAHRDPDDNEIKLWFYKRGDQGVGLMPNYPRLIRSGALVKAEAAVLVEALELSFGPSKVPRTKPLLQTRSKNPVQVRRLEVQDPHPHLRGRRPPPALQHLGKVQPHELEQRSRPCSRKASSNPALDLAILQSMRPAAARTRREWEPWCQCNARKNRRRARSGCRGGRAAPWAPPPARPGSGRAVEAFYQWHRCRGRQDDARCAAACEAILATPSSREGALKAKRTAAQVRELCTPQDWDTVKDGVASAGLRLKFAQRAELRRRLLATGQRPLVHTSQFDRYWGVVVVDGKREGQNVLGRMMQRMREHLQVVADVGEEHSLGEIRRQVRESAGLCPHDQKAPPHRRQRPQVGDSKTHHFPFSAAAAAFRANVQGASLLDLAAVAIAAAAVLVTLPLTPPSVVRLNDLHLSPTILACLPLSPALSLCCHQHCGSWTSQDCDSDGRMPRPRTSDK
ncbi:Immune-associated nucleotide-binding protein 7 (AtIAN7) (AIG1-like protein) [Durusdinium trenchii]|uniref:Immune-associated nucleotide-binding protein 7 (AtIAN7) (AIG1-like protein) n=1 Tax=Durusdinium trenchii TaxID=1381693 RepID=A0ABP0QTM1_9DINO